ncbi:septum formation family protein [Actinospongicola halichondriae]|uniref:septum formation family protein n=1 Tax=Actinospongicola halichondriae TaxID=3236844 RepID=UPI003D40F530
MRATRSLLWIAAGALAVAACSGSSDDAGNAPTSTTGPPVTAGPVAATELAPGDCVTGLVIGVDERRQIDAASVVRCDQPHELEVFAVFDLRPVDFNAADGSYPGQQRVVDAANGGCGDRLEQLGDVAESIGLIAVWPTPESWTQGDRSVACAAYSLTGTPFGDDILDS